MRRSIVAALLVGGALAAGVTVARPTEHEVTQKDRSFSVSRLQVHKGDQVSFKNLDPFFHNIFSVTKGSEFDLGAFPNGEAKSVRLDRVGIVEVECALHPEMKLEIDVRE